MGRIDATHSVDVRELQMSYGAHRVLHSLDLQIAQGEILALLGPNGAGKTTTLEVLEGFRKRSGGHVCVLGSDPEHANEAWRARLGIVLQSWRDHGRWRVRELLNHIGRYYQPYSTADHRRPTDVDELLSNVGLMEHSTKQVKKLSGGQRRRLDVAIGLVGNPELLFLDEPTVGFDPEARRDFHRMIKGISVRARTSIILTTHDLVEAETLAHTIAILVDGHIAALGSPRELASRFSGLTTISYRSHGEACSDKVPESEVPAQLAQLLAGRADVSDLEVRRSSLEDYYLSMVEHPRRSHHDTDTTVEAV